MVEDWGVDEVWSGGARGADELGVRVAEEMGLKVVVRMADWKRWGKAAGVKRTREMLEEMGEYVVGLMLWDGMSRGTRYTIEMMEKLGLDVRVVR